MIFGGTSPYHKDWLTKQQLPVLDTTVPEMGLPTVIDADAKQSGFQQMKERNRLMKQS